MKFITSSAAVAAFAVNAAAQTVSGAAEGFAVDMSDAEPEQFVSVLAAGGARDDLQLRELALDHSDDLVGLRFVLDGEDKEFRGGGTGSFEQVEP